MDIKTVGIIGMGQMGLGITEVFILSGYEVLVTDVNETSLLSTKNSIKFNLEKLEKKK